MSELLPAPRGTSSPLVRHHRLSSSRERASSGESTSLRLDAIFASNANAAASLSSSPADHHHSLRQSPVPNGDDDDDEDAESSRLLPGRSRSPVQVVRKLSGSSPSQPSRSLSASGLVSASSHGGHMASTLLSHSPGQQSRTLQSVPALLTNESSPSHGHGFGSRSRSGSFGYGSPSAAASSLPAQLRHLFLLQCRRRPLRTALVLLLYLLPLLLLYVDWTGKCNMSANLAPLLLFTVSAFNAADIEYWLDYGTLLGAVRSSSVIPHEFDIDLSSSIDECERILQLEPDFSRAGFRMYGRSDWVREKASFLFGYGGYLHKPCVRIYDPRTLYYVDVDWHQRLQASMLPASPLPPDYPLAASTPSASPYGSVYLPRAYTPADGDLWCNEEGFNGNDPGGCRRDSAIFPLSRLQMYGVEMKAPARSEELLRDMYGDSWRQPVAKGYKLLFCALMSDGEDGQGRGRLAVWGGVALLYVGLPLAVWAVGRADRRLAQWLVSKW